MSRRGTTWPRLVGENATRWGLLGAGFGLAATAVCWMRERTR